MKQYYGVLNFRTIITVVITAVTTYVCYLYNIRYYVDITLLSIAIIFPLVFTIRGSFRRREKALEHLSQFRSALKTVHYFVMSNAEMNDKTKSNITSALGEISEATIEHLKMEDNGTKDLDTVINKIFVLVGQSDEAISRRLKDRIFRFMNDLHDSIENLRAIHIHRTPISLKAYCLVFIYIFPFIYVPTIISNIGAGQPEINTYFIVILTEFILISLYNIQDQLEYPFDDKGLDDIKLDNFKMDR